MLGKLFEVTTALVSSTVDAVMATGEYVWEDIASIPNAIEKGWNEGIMPHTDEETSAPTETSVEKSSKFGAAA